MATRVFKGKAQVSGCAFSADVILYPIAESLKLAHAFEKELVKDSVGQTCSARAWEETYTGDIAMVLLDQSATSTAANAALGAAMLAPLAVVTVSGCDVAAWNTTWLHDTGASVDLSNNTVGKLSYKLMRWADAAQNALMATTPG